MSKRLSALVTVIGLAMAGPVFAGIPFPVETVCPLDGQKFTHTETASYSTWGQELDGKPIGSWTFPMPIPQCPGSRLPVIQETYSDEEKAALRALVETPGYKAIQNEASYYVLDYVRTQLGQGDPPSHLWLLLQASWQVREDEATYARYAQELALAFDQALGAWGEDNEGDEVFFRIAVSNVLRQAGNFDAAAAYMADLNMPEGANEIMIKSRDMTLQMIADRNPAVASATPSRF